MADKSKIPWTEATLDVVGGCTKVSSGCRECYALPLIGNRLANNPACKDRYKGLVKDGKWTGTIKLFEDRLDKPLHWRKPRKIFICPYSDLFHESVPLEFIERVWDTMFNCPQHLFQILTKRPARLMDFGHWMLGQHRRIDYSNLSLGITAENQEMADKRIPLLLQIPAAVRFVSVEPMLGPVEMSKVELPDTGDENYSNARCHPLRVEEGAYSFGRIGPISWVIIGCESGPNRRPCKIEWVRDLVRQCDAAGIPVFIKQLNISGKASKNPAEWPEDLRRQEYPNV